MSLKAVFKEEAPVKADFGEIVTGLAATVSVGTVTDGETASVVNSGTEQNAKLDFVLPRGAKGDPGGVVSFNGRTGTVMPEKGDYTAEDVGAAPEGYGLGGAAKRLTSEDDLNNIWENGWYFWGSDKPANAPKMNPGGAADSYIFMRVTNYDFKNVLQEYWSLNQNSQNQARRINRNGTWGLLEWYNPPMQIEVEYRTTERFNGKPVYRKLINFGQLPNNSTKTVFISDESVNLLSAFGYQYNSNQIIPNGCYGGDASKQVLVGGNGQNLIIATNFTPNETNAYIEVKYTKTAD